MNTDDTPWLREQVDEDLVGLFSEDEEAVAQTVSRLIERLASDEDLEERLVETLETSLQEQNDETAGSVWVALILGEIGSDRAIAPLLEGLARDDDEEFQNACGVALLKCGAPAIEALVEMIEEDTPGDVFLKAAYGRLAAVGYLGDADLRNRVMGFLTERLEAGESEELSDTAVEGISLAAAWLGHRHLLPVLENLSKERYSEKNPVLLDAIGMLSENEEGHPIAGDLIPGEEEYRWAFEHRGESFRPDRPSFELSVGERSVEVAVPGNDSASGGRAVPKDADTGRLYRGLGAVTEGEFDAEDEELTDEE